MLNTEYGYPAPPANAERGYAATPSPDAMYFSDGVESDYAGDRRGAKRQRTESAVREEHSPTSEPTIEKGSPQDSRSPSSYIAKLWKIAQPNRATNDNQQPTTKATETTTDTRTKTTTDEPSAPTESTVLPNEPRESGSIEPEDASPIPPPEHRPSNNTPEARTVPIKRPGPGYQVWTQDPGSNLGNPPSPPGTWQEKIKGLAIASSEGPSADTENPEVEDTTDEDSLAAELLLQSSTSTEPMAQEGTVPIPQPAEYTVPWMQDWDSETATESSTTFQAELQEQYRAWNSHRPLFSDPILQTAPGRSLAMASNDFALRANSPVVFAQNPPPGPMPSNGAPAKHDRTWKRDRPLKLASTRPAALPKPKPKPKPKRVGASKQARPRDEAQPVAFALKTRAAQAKVKATPSKPQARPPSSTSTTPATPAKPKRVGASKQVWPRDAAPPSRSRPKPRAAPVRVSAPPSKPTKSSSKSSSGPSPKTPLSSDPSPNTPAAPPKPREERKGARPKRQGWVWRDVIPGVFGGRRGVEAGDGKEQEEGDGGVDGGVGGGSADGGDDRDGDYDGHLEGGDEEEEEMSAGEVEEDAGGEVGRVSEGKGEGKGKGKEGVKGKTETVVKGKTVAKEMEMEKEKGKAKGKTTENTKTKTTENAKTKPKRKPAMQARDAKYVPGHSDSASES